jgi:hypothetical protein
VRWRNSALPQFSHDLVALRGCRAEIGAFNFAHVNANFRPNEMRCPVQIEWPCGKGKSVPTAFLTIGVLRVVRSEEFRRGEMAQSGATMKVSGVVSFEGLTAAGVRILREFESQKLSGLGFTFGPSPDKAIVRWDSVVRFAVISHMAALVANHQEESRLPDFSPPELD